MNSTATKGQKMKNIKAIARGIKDEMQDYPDEARDEVLGEFIAITVREEELTAREISELYELLGQ
jgi:hypothetical protein